MVGNNDSGVWLVATQDHVAPRLTAEHEPGPLEDGPHFSARQIGGEFGRVAVPRTRRCLRSRSLDFHELLAGFGRYGIAGVTAVLDVKFNRFTDVVERLGTIVAWPTHPGNAGTLAT